jgi:hypothetical protein
MTTLGEEGRRIVDKVLREHSEWFRTHPKEVEAELQAMGAFDEDQDLPYPVQVPEGWDPNKPL